MQKVPMTVLGAKKLREELTHLKQVERPRIINAISEARKHGDLKENAEYHAAREEQGFAEGRILEIESKLSMAQVIDVASMENDGRVIFGSTIKLHNPEAGEIVYQIVGEDEASVALIGKFSGDAVNVHTPEGSVEYEIIEVNYV